jgi:hypothetical protein
VVRQDEAKSIEVRGGARAHRCWQILLGMLADVRTSDEESLGLGSVSSGRTKGRWGRWPRATYRRGFDGYLVREVTAGSKSRWPFPVTERRRREIGGEERADTRVPSVGEREGKR